MENMRKSSKETAIMAGKSKPDHVKCKKHPKHQQSPGVCSLCLSERLSQISSSSSYGSRRSTSAAAMAASSSPSSLSSYYSSSSASSCSSPVHRYEHFTKEGKISSVSFLLNGKDVLLKSRSVAFFPRMKSGQDHNDTKKKGGAGFWSKLIRPRTKRMEAETLMHSRTVRETMTT
ncbi:hypothetical protein F2P56_012308 [Juglans regia]|uniref:Uncharacterized protein n=2 Tax=Juglans regia TaxID=51240 RepID=A0A833XIN4_JUGRE|nr:uncharacterized protein LOC109001134 [Juglans regia]KAF5468131.1 hypothetical protein F2P56_012308 [Juglans regia]